METPTNDHQIHNICKKYGIEPDELLRRIFLKELGPEAQDEDDSIDSIEEDSENSDMFLTDIEKELGPLIPPVPKRRQ